MKDLQTKSVKELNETIENLRSQLFMLRFQNSTGQLDQPHKISLVKKDIARVFSAIKVVEAKKTVEKVKKVAKGDK
ncbi:50S ribosomal protein L29 [Candidatus Mycoplasma mahonii]|uniref:50S ribosomal protein L29 n=1 Tax=Candidatus Mycoplasma mahonii TaxID=3004105 RepID=UPI0026F0694D|nr:50S ribosomal protein L29 [Candidatus Mycoplasma mahonii]WKX02245.1 50S ribosomal protein L29 [Candidatus Mycoplasma mahonii]